MVMIVNPDEDVLITNQEDVVFQLRQIILRHAAIVAKLGGTFCQMEQKFQEGVVTAAKHGGTLHDLLRDSQELIANHAELVANYTRIRKWRQGLTPNVAL